MEKFNEFGKSLDELKQSADKLEVEKESQRVGEESAREKLPDLSGYLESRKKIVLPLEETGDLREEIENNKGSYLFDDIHVSDSMEIPSDIRFIDKEANVAKLEIYMNEIAEMAEEADEIKKELKTTLGQTGLKSLKHKLQESMKNKIDKIGLVYWASGDKESRERLSKMWERIGEAQKEYEEKMKEQKD